MEQNQVTLVIPEGIDPVAVFGVNDAILRGIEEKFESRITVRGDEIVVSGNEVEVHTITSLFSDIFKRVERGEAADEAQIGRTIDLLRNGEFAPRQLRDDVLYTFKGKSIRPKTAGQKRYIDAIRANTVTFGIGPAGTGKTYLAMALAMASLKRRECNRIILTRPVVEAGESLGFLPGTLTEKVDPYIRPLYDALFDMVDGEHGNRLIENGTIEIAPLAFMRGRTLNDAFIILDEAQNTTHEQMKMFLTRLGFNSKMIITGDVTQVDLSGKRSGLLSVRDVLKSIDDIAFVDLTARDVVRHSLVGKIVAAYERAAEERQKRLHAVSPDAGETRS